MISYFLIYVLFTLYKFLKVYRGNSKTFFVLKNLIISQFVYFNDSEISIVKKRIKFIAYILILDSVFVYKYFYILDKSVSIEYSLIIATIIIFVFIDKNEYLLLQRKFSNKISQFLIFIIALTIVVISLQMNSQQNSFYLLLINLIHFVISIIKIHLAVIITIFILVLSFYLLSNLITFCIKKYCDHCLLKNPHEPHEVPILHFDLVMVFFLCFKFLFQCINSF